MQTNKLFYDDHYDRLISEFEFKPRLKLAKISEKYGFEDWLEGLKIQVKDIWTFYLFDESLAYHWCSPETYHHLGNVGYWYDDSSLKIPVTQQGNAFVLANGDAIASEYIEDGEFLQHHWFQDQLAEAGGENTDGNASRSILIHDFNTHEGLFSLKELGIDSEDLEVKTAAEILSEAYDAVLEYRNNGTDEDLFNLFKEEVTA